MKHRVLWNRVLHWSFTAILTATCVLSAHHMQRVAAELDALSNERRQALRSLRDTQRDLAERRGRYKTESASLHDDIKTSLSDPAIEVLFRELHPVPRTTHAGLLLQLLPGQGEDG